MKGDGLDWRADAACLQHDPEIFFPPVGSPGKDAKKVCAGCPVKDECLSLALGNYEEYGIYGGLNYKQRCKLRKAA